MVLRLKAWESRSPPGLPAHPFFVCRLGAGWSSPVARQAHNLKVIGSNPIPATNAGHAAGTFSQTTRPFVDRPRERSGLWNGTNSTGALFPRRCHPSPPHWGFELGNEKQNERMAEFR